jgi:ribosome-binding protein aMBF1 (putative translation factor)
MKEIRKAVLEDKHEAYRKMLQERYRVQMELSKAAWEEASPMRVGQIIREARAKKGLTLDDTIMLLGKESRISRASLSQVELGGQQLSLRQYHALNQVLDINLFTP